MMRHALLVAVALGAVLVHGDDVDCASMRIKELRKFLADRGLKCDGCAEKADYVSMCNENKDTPLKPAEPAPEPKGGDPEGGDPGAGKQSIEDMLAGLKGIPGMENVKMFGADDLKNMGPDGMGNVFGRRPPDREHIRKEMVDFYTMYGLEDKLDGVDAALDKFKGKENKIMPKLYKKYKENIDAYYAKLDEEENFGDGLGDIGSDPGAMKDEV